jgi:hypothetical protein
MTTSTIPGSTGFSGDILLKKALLICGILSSLHYVAINIFVPMQFPGYSPVSQTVSELSAIGAPTRQLWVLLAMVYILLVGAFGWGVLKSAGRHRPLRITGTLIIVYCVINFFWPPMHLRGNERTLTDNLHIVWAMVALLNMMLIMGFGAAALGRGFRLYTIATWVAFIVFGVLTGIDGPRIAANLPTPWIGIWERINIGAFMLWVLVLALVLLRKKNVLN